MQFTDFKLDEEILKALERMGFKEPTPIQKETIPILLEGKDLIGLAQTGSGKTAACAIPMCQKVDTSRKQVQVLIIVPTRELALQYATETQKIGGLRNVKSFALYGGEDAAMQSAKLKHGVQVLIATPGRLIDFVYKREIDLSHVEALVLDEADEMLSMGFIEDLEFIFQCLVQEHQTLLFSATMPKEIKRIAQNWMKEPKEITLQTEVASPKNIDHRFLYMPKYRPEETLVDLIKEHKPKQSIIFVDSRHYCERLCKELKRQIRDVDFLHGGLSQDVRTIITNKFRSGKVKHLVATDVAARGLDFSGVTHVFQSQLPRDVDSYIHRSGRTGRQSRTGTCISLVTKREIHQLNKILKRLHQEPNWIGDPPPEGGGEASRPPRRSGGGRKPAGAGGRGRRPRRPSKGPKKEG